MNDNKVELRRKMFLVAVLAFKGYRQDRIRKIKERNQMYLTFSKKQHTLFLNHLLHFLTNCHSHECLNQTTSPVNIQNVYRLDWYDGSKRVNSLFFSSTSNSIKSICLFTQSIDFEMVLVLVLILQTVIIIIMA